MVEQKWIYYLLKNRPLSRHADGDTWTKTHALAFSEGDIAHTVCGKTFSWEYDSPRYSTPPTQPGHRAYCQRCYKKSTPNARITG